MAYSGGNGATAPLVWLRMFLSNFCTVFVSFVSRLNRKIRVARLRVTDRVFCMAVKNSVKMHPDSLFLGQKMFFFWGGSPTDRTLNGQPLWNFGLGQMFHDCPHSMHIGIATYSYIVTHQRYNWIPSTRIVMVLALAFVGWDASSSGRGMYVGPWVVVRGIRWS